MEPYDLCRLCSGRTDYVKVFGDSTLPDKIGFTLGIKVAMTDDHLSICKICKTKVEEFYEFKTMCQSTESQGIGKSLSGVKIKLEQLSDDDTVPMASLPCGSTIGVPTFYTRDADGKFVAIPAVVPIGEPIPITALGTSGIDAHPVTSFVTSSKATTPTKVEPTSSFRASSHTTMAVPDTSRSLSPYQNASSEKSLNMENKVVLKSEETQDSTSPKSLQDDIDSSDDMKAVDALINEVLTETEKEPLKEQERPDTTFKPQPPLPVARRGRKRRGSSLSFRESKHRRSSRNPSSEKSPQTPESTSKRLTRSSTGTRPRNQRKFFDSSESDGDFNPDDPDDPNDPTDPSFTTSKNTRSSSSCDSDSDSDSEKTAMKKQKSKILLQSKLLSSGRTRNEKDTMKTCPTCKLTYKHWVSYDTHVNECKLQDHSIAKKEEPKEDNQKELKCVLCFKLVIGTKTYQEHMQEHAPKKAPSYECNECKEKFDDKGALICHNALRHRANISEPIIKPERKKLFCEPCKETFLNSGDYICHQVLFHKKK